MGYRQVSNIRRILVGNKIVDHSDVVAITWTCRRCSKYIFILDLTLDWAKTNARQDEKHLCLGIWCALYLRDFTVISFFAAASSADKAPEPAVEELPHFTEVLRKGDDDPDLPLKVIIYKIFSIISFNSARFFFECLQIPLFRRKISLAQWKTVVTPLLTCWRFHRLTAIPTPMGLVAPGYVGIDQISWNIPSLASEEMIKHVWKLQHL